MAPVASPVDGNRYAKTLFERVPLTCPKTGLDHNWSLLASYTDYDCPHDPNIMNCSDCGQTRLEIHFDDDDPEYEIFRKREMWDEHRSAPVAAEL